VTARKPNGSRGLVRRLTRGNEKDGRRTIASVIRNVGRKMREEQNLRGSVRRTSKGAKRKKNGFGTGRQRNLRIDVIKSAKKLAKGRLKLPNGKGRLNGEMPTEEIESKLFIMQIINFKNNANYKFRQSWI